MTKRGALPEVVETTGYFVTYGDPKAIAKGIEMALSSNKGNDARERIKSMFSMQRREEKMVSLLENLVRVS